MIWIGRFIALILFICLCFRLLVTVGVAQFSSVPLDIPGFVTIVSAIISFFILVRPPKETTRSQRIQMERREKFRLPSSFDRGLYGSVIGGSLAGMGVAASYVFVYYDVFKGIPDFQIIQLLYLVVKMMFSGSLAGLLFGFFVQLFFLYFKHRFRNRSSLYQGTLSVVGGSLGGLLSGVLSGVLGGFLFVPVPMPAVEFNCVFLFGSLLPLILFVYIVLEEFEGDRRSLIRAFFASTIIMAFYYIAFYLSVHLNVYFINCFSTDTGIVDDLPWIRCSILFGSIIGTSIGLYASLVLIFYFFWNSAIDIHQPYV